MVTTSIIMIGYVSIGTVLYGLPFFELLPHYECLDSSSSWTSCEPEYICSNPDVEYRPDFTFGDSLHNWSEQLGLVCASKTGVAMLGSIFDIVQALGFLLCPFIISKIGLRRMWLLSVYM